jgi:hypothetical protein
MGAGLRPSMHVVDADVRVKDAMLPASNTSQLSNAVMQQFLCGGDWTALHIFPLLRLWSQVTEEPKNTDPSPSCQFTIIVSCLIF